MNAALEAKQDWTTANSTTRTAMIKSARATLKDARMGSGYGYQTAYAYMILKLAGKKV